jgi:hypothetical protein
MKREESRTMEQDGEENPMTAPKKTEGALAEKDSQSLPPDRLPAALRKMLQATPKNDWSKIRAFFVESEEEGELVEMLPEMNRVMKVCPPKLVGRVLKHEITGDELEKGYMQLHDAIHGVRQALYALLHLAGYRDYQMPQSLKVGGGPEEGSRPAAPLGEEAASDPLTGSPALGSETGLGKRATLIRSGKN